MGKDDGPSINWGALTAFSGLLVAFGALAYVLGLLVMWIPASKATHDFVLSWSTVSLMPRTTVAGIGVRWSLVGAHLLYVVLSIPLWFLGLWVYSNFQEPMPIRRKALAYVGIVVSIFALVLALLYVERIIAYLSDLPRLRYALVPIVMVASLSPLLKDRIESGSISQSAVRRVLLTAAFFIFLNFVTSIFVITSVGQLGRPVAEVTGDKEIKGSFTGLLWTHTEGFWYLFDREYSLCAIPDEYVRTVRIVKSGSEKGNAARLTSCP